MITIQRNRIHQTQWRWKIYEAPNGFDISAGPLTIHLRKWGTR